MVFWGTEAPISGYWKPLGLLPGFRESHARYWPAWLSLQSSVHHRGRARRLLLHNHIAESVRLLCRVFCYVGAGVLSICPCPHSWTLSRASWWSGHQSRSSRGLWISRTTGRAKDRPRLHGRRTRVTDTTQFLF